MWQDDRSGTPEVLFRELEASGALYGQEKRVNCGTGAAVGPTLARLDNGFGIAWSDDSDGNFEIYGAFPSAKVIEE